MIPLKRSCKEVSALVVAREDRELRLMDRLAVRVHMSICVACPKFERQFLLMRHAMFEWRQYGNDAAAETTTEASALPKRD